MEMRKEPIVFLATAGLLGWSAFSIGMFSGKAASRSTPRATPLDYESVGVPDLAVVLPEEGRDALFERNLFAPPSATSPLPPLAPEPPPLEPLPALAAPSSFGPAAPWFGSLLREPATPAAARDVVGLFAVEEFADDVDTELVPAGADEADGSLPDDPEARAARIAGLKTQYDWLYTNGYQFGRIVNEDRYRLEMTAETPLLFVPLNPATGAPIYGPTPIEYGPDRVREWGLVESPLTEIELGFAVFGDPLSPSRFQDAVRFAQDCLRLRNETPRALEVAEELFRRAQAINTQDSVEPRLGLARCYELGFRLEDAYRTYEELLSSGFANHPVVLSRFGSLLARLRLDGDAEARFASAVRVERGNWEAQWRYGTFLLERGRLAEARERLEAAAEREPKGAEDRIWRVRVRLDHGHVLLATGDADRAFQAFSSALNADVANDLGLADVALAGMVAAARDADGAEAAALLEGLGQGLGEGAAVAGGGFDLLVSMGLAAMDAGRFEEAAQVLQAAVGADPFRSHVPLRALSRLAEITGNPEDAEAFADRALEALPRDPWTLYQKGRLAEAAGDERAAREAYQAALDVELDLAPVLERMAALSAAAGDHGPAERYFERAVDLEPENAPLWSRRGWNALASGDLDLARSAFQRARGLDLSLGSARAGLAWWNYASGNAGEAVTLLGEIVDDGRASDAVDDLALFAEAQAKRILDHDTKEVFRDRFDRQDGAPQNGWKVQMGLGPEVVLVDGAVRIRGQHEGSGRSRLFRDLPPDRFLAFSCLLTVGPEAKGTRSGIFLSSERTVSSGASEVRAEVALCRNRDGQLEVRVQKNATDDEATYVRIPGPEWPVGEPIRVTLERTGEDLEARYTLYVDGEPVADGLEVSGMGGSNMPLRFGAFVEGEPGRRADLVVDDVRVVRRK